VVAKVQPRRNGRRGASLESTMTIAPNSLAARDIAYTIHPYTNLRQHERQGPLVITGGEGVWVWDDDGKRYLEGLAGLWCTGLGFSEKRLAAVAQRQMERLPYMHVFAHRGTEPVIELAEHLIRIAPEPMAKASSSTRARKPSTARSSSSGTTRTAAACRRRSGSSAAAAPITGSPSRPGT
jgi:4-aminobutyrate aminotransferase-like enzyme